MNQDLCELCGENEIDMKVEYDNLWLRKKIVAKVCRECRHENPDDCLLADRVMRKRLDSHNWKLNDVWDDIGRQMLIFDGKEPNKTGGNTE
jgi:hypothetical protein